MPKSLKYALVALAFFIFIIPLIIFMFGVFFIEKVQAQSTIKGKVDAMKSVVLGTVSTRKIKTVKLPDVVRGDGTRKTELFKVVFDAKATGKVISIHNTYKSDLTPQYKVGDTIDLSGKELSEDSKYPVSLATFGSIPEMVDLKYLQMEKMNIIPADAFGVVEYTVQVPYDQFTIHTWTDYSPKFIGA